jgi:hypothetical protein
MDKPDVPSFGYNELYHIKLYHACHTALQLQLFKILVTSAMLLQEEDATGPIVTNAEQEAHKHQQHQPGQAATAGNASQPQAAGEAVKQQQDLLGRKFGGGAAAAA